MLAFDGMTVFGLVICAPIAVLYVVVLVDQWWGLLTRREDDR